MNHAEYQRKWYAKHKDRLRKKAMTRYYSNKKYRQSINNKSSKKRLLELRLEALRMYGEVCVCCGEDNVRFLTFDHINNDGHKNRKVGRQLYRYILTNKPTDLQLLCFNCNCGRSLNSGQCPHIVS